MQGVLSAGNYLGRSAQTREAGGFLFAESVYAAHAALPRHAHENPFLYLVLRGVCLDRHDGGEHTIPAETMLYHPAGEAHANRWGPEGGACFHIELLDSRRAALEGPSADERAALRGGACAWLAGRIYRNFLLADSASSLALEGLTLEILAELSRASRPSAESLPPAWLRSARDMLHDRCAERLTIDEIAAEVGVHPSHLSRAFHHHYRATIGEYLRQIRVEHARVELAQGRKGLAEIALDAGFADQSHFTKVFQRATGSTPAEYRRLTCNPRTMN